MDIKKNWHAFENETKWVCAANDKEFLRDALEYLTWWKGFVRFTCGDFSFYIVTVNLSFMKLSLMSEAHLLLYSWWGHSAQCSRTALTHTFEVYCWWVKEDTGQSHRMTEIWLCILPLTFPEGTGFQTPTKYGHHCPSFFWQLIFQCTWNEWQETFRVLSHLETFSFTSSAGLLLLCKPHLSLQPLLLTGGKKAATLFKDIQHLNLHTSENE